MLFVLSFFFFPFLSRLFLRPIVPYWTFNSLLRARIYLLSSQWMFLYIRIWPNHYICSRMYLPFFSFCCFFMCLSLSPFSFSLSFSSRFFFILIVGCDSCWNSDMLRVIDSLGMIKGEHNAKTFRRLHWMRFRRNSTRFHSFNEWTTSYFF